MIAGTKPRLRVGRRAWHRCQGTLIRVARQTPQPPHPESASSAAANEADQRDHRVNLADSGFIMAAEAATNPIHNAVLRSILFIAFLLTSRNKPPQKRRAHFA
jgi:hypothetical protein